MRGPGYSVPLNSYSPLAHSFTVPGNPYSDVPQTIADKIETELSCYPRDIADICCDINNDLNVFLLEDIHLSPFADSTIVLGATWDDVYDTLEYAGYSYTTIHDRCDDCGICMSLTHHILLGGLTDTGDIVTLLRPYLAHQVSRTSGRLCYTLPHGEDVLQFIKGY